MNERSTPLYSSKEEAGQRKNKMEVIFPWGIEGLSMNEVNIELNNS